MTVAFPVPNKFCRHSIVALRSFCTSTLFVDDNCWDLLDYQSQTHKNELRKAVDRITSNEKASAHEESRGRPCDPILDGKTDVGILSCGFNYYCAESQESNLGGFCASVANVDQKIRFLQPSDFCDQFTDEFGAQSCDCSEFDSASGTGSIDCIYGENICICPDLCTAITVEGQITSFTTQSITLCYDFTAGYKTNFCYSYSEEQGTCTISIGEVACTSCEQTTCDDQVSTSGSIFDCANISGGARGNSCHDDTILPELFERIEARQTPTTTPVPTPAPITAPSVNSTTTSPPAPITDSPTSSPSDPPIAPAGGTPWWFFCFSSNVLVQVKGKGMTRMDQLTIGDFVLARGANGNSYFAMVYSFGHYAPNATTEYLQVYFQSSDEKKRNETTPLEITRDHLLYRFDDFELKKTSLVAAGDIKAGDVLVTSAVGSTPATIKTLAKVKDVRKVARVGAYAPFTSSGDIVLTENNIVASNYIALPPAFQEQHWLSLEQQHWLQHVAYTPYRWYCIHYLGSGCQNETFHPDTGLSVAVRAWLPVLGLVEGLALNIQVVHLVAAAIFGYYVILKPKAAKKTNKA